MENEKSILKVRPVAIPVPVTLTQTVHSDCVNVTKRINSLEVRFEEKLEPLMISVPAVPPTECAPPTELVPGNEAPLVEIPPLFNELGLMFKEINAAVGTLEVLLNRLRL